MNKHRDRISTDLSVLNPQAFLGGLRQIIGLALGSSRSMICKIQSPLPVSWSGLRFIKFFLALVVIA